MSLYEDARRAAGAAQRARLRRMAALQKATNPVPTSDGDPGTDRGVRAPGKKDAQDFDVGVQPGWNQTITP